MVCIHSGERKVTSGSRSRPGPPRPRPGRTAALCVRRRPGFLAVPTVRDGDAGLCRARRPSRAVGGPAGPRRRASQWAAPTAPALRDLPGEGAGVLPAATPFARPADTAGVPALCRAGRQFALQPRPGLLGAAVFDPDRPTGGKEDRVLRVNGHQGVGLVQVDADGRSADRFGGLTGHGDATQEFPVSLDDGHAVNFPGLFEWCVERFRHRVPEARAPADRPEGERAVGAEEGSAWFFLSSLSASRPRVPTGATANSNLALPSRRRRRPGWPRATANRDLTLPRWASGC